MPTAADTTNQTATRVGHRQLQAITDQLDATDRELLAGGDGVGFSSAREGRRPP